ncbi:MAG: hypothetical protein U9Q58_08950 [Pseudomonadota bacterium]|nr:hypothetical protein [Pseudomonadota bacterium]
MEEEEDLSKFALGLSKLRRRRCFFWGVILIYIPSIWLSLRLTNSDRQTAKVFAVWFLLVLISSIFTAVGKCPRCGNLFHVNGFMPLFLRRCLHCGLHITADKKQHEEKNNTNVPPQPKR